MAAAAACLLALVSGDSPGHLVLLHDAAAAEGAVCLDGSPGAYYLRRGQGAGATKWLIHHEGGGWCRSLERCAVRSATQLGSSGSYQATAAIAGGGYLSEDPAVNPMMHDWNVARLKYCDGGSFSGDNATVTELHGRKLYFRGARILRAMQRDLASKGLANATDVVISGCSAGGLATFLHLDGWADFLRRTNPNLPSVVGMPDSGFFLDFEGPHDYRSDLAWVFGQMNSSASVNQECVRAHAATGDAWKCMFAEYVAPFVKTRMFVLQSTYDSDQVASILGTPAVGPVNAYGEDLAARLGHAVLTDHQENGAFLDACSHHCGTNAWSDYTVDGRSQAQAFQAWYERGSPALGNQGLFWQRDSYPCTSCCAGPRPHSQELSETAGGPRPQHRVVLVLVAAFAAARANLHL